MAEWTEVHRPRNLDQMVLPDELRTILSEAAVTGDVPNLLLFGPAGTGKTTAARVLIHRYFFPNEASSSFAQQQQQQQMSGRSPLDLDVLTLNASDDRSLDMVRQQLRQFIKLAPCPGNPRGLRFVMLDEFDAMTKPAQLALKALIRDQYCSGTSNGSVRFILICNYLSRIDPALRDELVCLRFNALPPAAVETFLRQVVDAETADSGKISDQWLAALRRQHGGSDLRAMIHSLQTILQEDDGELFDEEPPRQNPCELIECITASAPTRADEWSDRDRRAAILLFQATDHPERTVDPAVRAAALNFLLH